MKHFDLSIIGSGLSGILSLKAVLSGVINQRPYKPLDILVIEQQDAFWNGIPFGSNLSPNCLTITSVEEFLTDEADRIGFTTWLTSNKEHYLASYLQRGGRAAKQWYNDNKERVESSQWDTVFVPRYWYREYINEILHQLIITATALDAVNIVTLKGKVADIKQQGQDYSILFENAGYAENITTHKVLLAIGSPAIKPLTINVPNEDLLYIGDFYACNVDASLREIHETLKGISDVKKRNLFIVGSNASCTELLYLLSHEEELLESVNQIVVVSPSGALPNAINTLLTDCPPLDHLGKFVRQTNFDYQALIEATKADLGVINRGGVNTRHVEQLVTQAMNLKHQLTPEEREKFEAQFGTVITGSIRRMGKDYYNGIDRLIQAGKLTLLKGKYASVDNIDNDVLLRYTDADGQHTVYHFPVAALVNGTGFETLTTCSSALINNLVAGKLCKVNATGKGFEVNEDFQANKNLYVMGPLLAGNTNQVIHFWHLENVARIIHLVPMLAEQLLSEYHTALKPREKSIALPEK